MDEKSIAPNLYKIVDYLDKNSLLVASNWMKVVSVNFIFKQRKISTVKFRDSYAVPIIEYFVAVVRNEKALGDCPIMGKFVRYMVTKGITPQEIFDICMGFRRALIAFLIKDKTVLKNPDLFLDEISLVFDANLSGVLNIFTDLYAQSQKKIEIAKVQKDKLQQTLKIINSINTKIIILQNGRIILANRPFLEMIGVENLKYFYLKYESAFDFISEINMFEDEFKQDRYKWIQKTCENNKPFQSKIYNEKEKKTFSYSGRVTEMLVGDMKQYIVTLSNISEHIKDEKDMEDMLSHDELTGFRNYPRFEKLISKFLVEAKENNSRLFLAIIDIPNLRDINDVKGKDVGDMALSEVAEDLRFVVNKNIYLARLNGSRFAALLQYETEQSSYDWSIELFKKLNQREAKKTLVITEIDLSESLNNTFLRSYALMDKANALDDGCVEHDFKDIIEYKELPDQKEFTDRLLKVKTINMSLYYMELPISSETEILSVTTDNAKILLSSKQALVANIGMKIYFKLENIGTIKAIIQAVDKKKQVITIDCFTRDTHSPLNRVDYRVEAGEDIKAYISENGRDYPVTILDMNSKYIAVKIDRKRNFDINSLIFIDMLLPITDIPEGCVTNATITRIDKVEGGYKMVLLYHSSHSVEETLSKYIAKQQMEIIKSIQNK